MPVTGANTAWLVTVRANEDAKGPIECLLSVLGPSGLGLRAAAGTVANNGGCVAAKVSTEGTLCLDEFAVQKRAVTWFLEEW